MADHQGQLTSLLVVIGVQFLRGETYSVSCGPPQFSLLIGAKNERSQLPTARVRERRN
jgi:hypothetical protein